VPLQPDPAYSLRQQPAMLGIGGGRSILFVLEIECFQMQFVSGAIYKRATSGQLFVFHERILETDLLPYGAKALTGSWH
jgi:hypothetical protein